MHLADAEGTSLQELEREVRNGARFVVFLYCVSVLIMTFRRGSRVYLVRPGDSVAQTSLPYTLLTFVVGWWGIPWGPIYSVQCLYTNLSGGKDVTSEVMAALRLDFAEDPSTPFAPSAVLPERSPAPRPLAVAAILILVGIIIAALVQRPDNHSPPASEVKGNDMPPAEIPSTSVGKALILEADQAYPGRMNLGQVFRHLYSEYSARFGWEDATLIDFCGRLVEGSLKRGTTKEALAEEFNAIDAYDSGLLLMTSIGISEKAGLAEEDFRPLVLERAHSRIKDPAEIARFDTAMLGDGVLFTWRFAVGYEYYRRYKEQLDPNAGATGVRSQSLSQEEIDSILRSFGRD